MITDLDGVVWLKTEDAGYLDEEGRVWLVGRVKWMVEKGTQKFWSTVVEQKVSKKFVHFCVRCQIMYLLRFWTDVVSSHLLLTSITRRKHGYFWKLLKACLIKKKQVCIIMEGGKDSLHCFAFQNQESSHS